MSFDPPHPPPLQKRSVTHITHITTLKAAILYYGLPKELLLCHANYIDQCNMLGYSSHWIALLVERVVWTHFHLSWAFSPTKSSLCGLFAMVLLGATLSALSNPIIAHPLIHLDKAERPQIDVSCDTLNWTIKPPL